MVSGIKFYGSPTKAKAEVIRNLLQIAIDLNFKFTASLKPFHIYDCASLTALNFKSVKLSFEIGNGVK